MKKTGPVAIALGALFSSASYAQVPPESSPTTPDPEASPESTSAAPDSNVGAENEEIVVTALRRAEWR